MSVFENGSAAVSGGGGMNADVVVGTEEAEKKELKTETDKRDGSSEVVLWVKFLPRVVLRVLLVEADVSTRQIIAALLRKCSYRVSTVPDGLMAWETLKGRPHNIDLILTEVDLPLISGYALLTLVMEHDVCKNIPVIMMSSSDSISMVLKCMLKGAADFLIKPIRRNELRNLWQHVWRRQNLKAGHIPQNSLDPQPKIEASSGNNSASDHPSDHATSSNKRKECSEKRSDSHGLSHMKCGIASNLSNTEKEKYKECPMLHERSIIPESNTEDWPTRLGSVGASQNEAHDPPAPSLGEVITCGKIMIQDESAKPENNMEYVNTHGHDDELVESSGGAIDLIGAFDNGPKRTYGHMTINDGTKKFEYIPQLELSLRRFVPNNSNNQGVEERHSLNHSNASVFSWYTDKTLHPLFPMSSSNRAELKEDARKSPEQTNQVCQIVNEISERHGANKSGNQETVTTLVIGQSGQPELACANPQELIPVSGARLGNNSNGYGRIFPPVYHSQAWSPKLVSHGEQSPFPVSSLIHSNPKIRDHESDNTQCDETAINSVDQNMYPLNDMEVEEPRHGSPAAGQSTSSSMSNSVADHNNNSAYGSFSSRSDGNTTVAATAEKIIIPESSNDGTLFCRDGFGGMDSHSFSQREAALTKFRLKRKDRCFEKKVRYQSRKRLAELRPRVKGQFVRQVQTDVPTTADANNQ